MGSRHDDAFKDENHKLLAQDILYRMLDGEEIPYQKEEKAFRDMLKKSSTEDLNVYFHILDKLIDGLGIADEPILTFSTSDQLSFQMGIRYCLNLKGEKFDFIAPEEYTIEGVHKGQFEGKPQPSFFHKASADVVLQHYPAIEQAVQFELENGKYSNKKKYDNLAFRKAAFDKKYRTTFFDFQELDNMTTAVTTHFNEKTSIPVNQILFGPPGTGKTYFTKQYAVQIIEELTLEELTKKYPARTDINSKFEKYKERKQVEFITFHQSFSYEDFIEGIKPVLPVTEAKGEEDNTNSQTVNIAYELTEGIFKSICERADSYVNYEPKSQQDHFKDVISRGFEKANFFKMSIGNTAFSEDNEIFQYCIHNNCIAIGWGGEVDFSNVLSRKEIKDRLENQGVERSSYETTAVKTLVLDMQQHDFVFVSSGNYKIRAIAQITGDYYYDEDAPIRYRHFRKVQWLAKDLSLPVTELYKKAFSQQTIYGLNKALISRSFFEATPLKDSFRKNHVLIIDEINRGNISQIFGELITLLEPDKRSGNSEQLSIKLPYSKEYFSVPSNLYIIGTMNTADRSVEALDTALRRRFSFVEMPPRYDLTKLQEEVEGYKLADILKKINRRIEKLLGKDNLIGHSYFFEVKDTEELRQAFQNKIIPLLQEYFYGDFGKIGLVLGEGFVKPSEQEDMDIFATFGNYDSSGLAEKEIYRLADLVGENRLTEEEFEAALDALMK